MTTPPTPGELAERLQALPADRGWNPMFEEAATLLRQLAQENEELRREVVDTDAWGVEVSEWGQAQETRAQTAQQRVKGLEEALGKAAAVATASNLDTIGRMAQRLAKVQIIVNAALAGSEELPQIRDSAGGGAPDLTKLEAAIKRIEARMGDSGWGGMVAAGYADLRLLIDAVRG